MAGMQRVRDSIEVSHRITQPRSAERCFFCDNARFDIDVAAVLRPSTSHPVLEPGYFQLVHPEQCALYNARLRRHAATRGGRGNTRH